MYPDDVAAMLGYGLAILLAGGFWAAFYVLMLRRKQITIGSLLLLMAMLAVALAIMRAGLR
jgi:hypothetical protein